MRLVHSLLIFVCFTGCASAPGRPDSVPSPDIVARLVHPIFFGSTTSAPAAIEVTVHNRASVPLTLRRVEVDSPGMVQYTLVRTVRNMNETIEPGQSATVNVFATAVTRTSRPSEPLNFRTILEFRHGSSRWREIQFGSD